jgi:acetyl esterase/lipase
MSLSFDPEFAQVFAAMAEGMAGATHPPVGDVAARRAMWEPIIGAASAAQPVPADVTTTEYYATADDGTKITMRWYATTGAPTGPAALFFHGGGYVFGHIDLFDGPVARYVSASGVPMLSVEYRRAPEHPFPTPVEDAYTALRWLHQHADELGVDPARIGVMGDSAGGGLAAALSILTRERGGPAIARQILLMPMLDDRTTTPDLHIEPYLLWSYDDSRTAWPALLGDAAGGLDYPPRPLRPAWRTRAVCLPPTSRSASSTSSATRTSPTPSNSAGPAYPWSSTSTPVSRTSSTPSPSPPTSPAVPSPTAYAPSPPSSPSPPDSDHP